MNRTGRVFLVGAGPGDPGLLTIKGKDCLETADVVIYDRLVAPDILNLSSSFAEKIYVGKERDHHTVRQEKINELLVQRALEGFTVVRLKGGDPFVFGRGAEEAEVLREHGIEFEIVPGVSSAIAAPAYAGIPVTYRELATGFHVVTGHECASSPKTPWELLASPTQTLIILMGMSYLPVIIKKLLQHGRDPNTPVALIRSGTTPHHASWLGTLGTIVDLAQRAKIEPPVVIVIGEVVHKAKDLEWFNPEWASDISQTIKGEEC